MCRRRAIRLRVVAFVLAVRWPLTIARKSIHSYAKLRRATAWRAFASMVISMLRPLSRFMSQKPDTGVPSRAARLGWGGEGGRPINVPPLLKHCVARNRNSFLNQTALAHARASD